MELLSAEYTLLFNTLSKTIEELNEMAAKLMEVQQKAEELYIEKSA